MSLWGIRLLLPLPPPPPTPPKIPQKGFTIFFFPHTSVFNKTPSLKKSFPPFFAFWEISFPPPPPPPPQTPAQVSSRVLQLSSSHLTGL